MGVVEGSYRRKDCALETIGFGRWEDPMLLFFTVWMVVRKVWEREKVPDGDSTWSLIRFPESPSESSRENIRKGRRKPSLCSRHYAAYWLLDICVIIFEASCLAMLIMVGYLQSLTWHYPPVFLLPSFYHCLWDLSSPCWTTYFTLNY